MQWSLQFFYISHDPNHFTVTVVHFILHWSFFQTILGTFTGVGGGDRGDGFVGISGVRVGISEQLWELFRMKRITDWE